MTTYPPQYEVARVGGGDPVSYYQHVSPPAAFQVSRLSQDRDRGPSGIGSPPRPGSVGRASIQAIEEDAAAVYARLLYEEEQKGQERLRRRMKALEYYDNMNRAAVIIQRAVRVWRQRRAAQQAARLLALASGAAAVAASAAALREGSPAVAGRPAGAAMSPSAKPWAVRVKAMVRQLAFWKPKKYKHRESSGSGSSPANDVPCPPLVSSTSAPVFAPHLPPGSASLQPPNPAMPPYYTSSSTRPSAAPAASPAHHVNHNSAPPALYTTVYFSSGSRAAHSHAYYSRSNFAATGAGFAMRPGEGPPHLRSQGSVGEQQAGGAVRPLSRGSSTASSVGSGPAASIAALLLTHSSNHSAGGGAGGTPAATTSGGATPQHTSSGTAPPTPHYPLQQQQQQQQAGRVTFTQNSGGRGAMSQHPSLGSLVSQHNSGGGTPPLPPAPPQPPQQQPQQPLQQQQQQLFGGGRVTFIQHGGGGGDGAVSGPASPQHASRGSLASPHNSASGGGGAVAFQPHNSHSGRLTFTSHSSASGAVSCHQHYSQGSLVSQHDSASGRWVGAGPASLGGGLPPLSPIHQSGPASDTPLQTLVEPQDLFSAPTPARVAVTSFKQIVWDEVDYAKPQEQQQQQQQVHPGARVTGAAAALGAEAAAAMPPPPAGNAFYVRRPC